MEGTSDKGKERDTLLYGNMQKGVLSFLFRYNKKHRFILERGRFVEKKRIVIFTAICAAGVTSSQDRRAELKVRLAGSSAQSACGMEDFMKLLIVVDMQNDFVTGALEQKEAQAIVENVICKIKKKPRQNRST